MHRLTGDTGASAVEFALVLPFLLLLVFGIVDFGRYYNAQVSLTHGAREGVRSLALGDTTADLTPRLDPDHVRSLVPGTVGGAVTIGASQECADSTVDARLVLLNDFDFLTPLPALVAALGGDAWGDAHQVDGEAVMRCRG